MYLILIIPAAWEPSSPKTRTPNRSANLDPILKSETNQITWRLFSFWINRPTTACRSSRDSNRPSRVNKMRWTRSVILNSTKAPPIARIKFSKNWTKIPAKIFTFKTKNSLTSFWVANLITVSKKWILSIKNISNECSRSASLTETNEVCQTTPTTIQVSTVWHQASCYLKSTSPMKTFIQSQVIQVDFQTCSYFQCLASQTCRTWTSTNTTSTTPKR